MPRKSKAAEAAPLTSERLRSLLDYDPNSGVFVWRTSKGRRNAGERGGSPARGDYRQIGIDGHVYYEHRLVWLWVFGQFPTQQIDHKNGNGLDNRLENLRECVNAENCQNLGLRKSNTSGVTGVRWDRARQKWVAQIRRDGKITPLGRFSSFEDAHQTYLAAKRECHQFQPIPRELSV